MNAPFRTRNGQLLQADWEAARDSVKQVLWQKLALAKIRELSPERSDLIRISTEQVKIAQSEMFCRIEDAICVSAAELVEAMREVGE